MRRFLLIGLVGYGLRRWLLALFAVMVLLNVLPRPAQGQFTNKVTTTPVFLQDGFGPAGDLLPFGGQEYCVPTAVAMSLSYLGVNGFNQIGPSNPIAADGLNLDEVMAGLMGTSPTGGTYYSNVGPAIGTYLAAKGISSANYTFSDLFSPTLSQLAAYNQNQTVVDLACGYYNSGAARTGGHMVALLSQGVNALGQSSSQTIVINNPLPGALAPNADVPSNSLQYLNTVSTSGALTSDGALELDTTQYPGFWGSTQFVIEQALALTVNASQQSASDPALATWTLASAQTIDLQGGKLTVLAPIQGAGGFAKGDLGTLELEAPDAATGNNTVVAGTLRSDIASGLPFGSGSIALQAGTLQLAPSTGSANVNLAAASAAGQQLTFLYGATLALNRDGNNSLTFTIGGNTNGTTANIVRLAPGTLVIAPAGGIAGLGTSESVIVSGSGGNLPALTNGIVAPYIVGQNNDAGDSGDFLTYGSGGFSKATYTEGSVTPIQSAGTAAVFDANANQTVPSSSAVQIYALKVGAFTVGGGAGSDLKVGNQAGGQGGVILNGGAIGTSNLDFGSGEGLVYACLSGGTISANISSGTLTTFGPGSLTFAGANTYAGPTRINSGTLVAANASGSATGSGAVTVEANATLQINGPAGLAGSSKGTTVNPGATLLLNGGSLTGPLTLNGTLLGGGTINGAATVSGYVGSSATDLAAAPYAGVENIAFFGGATFSSSTVYAWRLNALDDAPADAANWSLLSFKSGTNNIGTSSSHFNFTLDLGPGVPDANSGAAFWNQPHQWLAATAPNGFNNIWWQYDFASYAQGSFSLSINANVSNFYVNYAPDQWRTASGSATWFRTQNWTTVVPNGPGVAANLWGLGGGTVDLGSNSATVSILSFSSSTSSYKIVASGSGGLILAGSGGAAAAVQVLAGNHAISAPLALNSVTNVSVANPGNSLALSGPVSGSGGLSFAGSGELILGGANTYSGPTSISQGELAAYGSLVSPVTVNSGGILAGTGSLTSVTVSPSGQIAPGNPSGTLSISGSLVLATGAMMDYELDTPTTSSLLACGGLSLNGQQFTDFDFTPTASFGPGAYDLIEAGSVPSGTLGSITSGTIDGYPATLAIQNNDVVLSVVPEPSTLALFGAGALALIGWAWRRLGPANQ